MFIIKDLFNKNYYTSKIDEFLAEFDKNHPRLSRSQRLEKEKYAKIFAKRDKVGTYENKPDFWDQF
jgi:hypothetical protein